MNSLNVLLNELDNAGLYKEADKITRMVLAEGFESFAPIQMPNLTPPNMEQTPVKSPGKSPASGLSNPYDDAEAQFDREANNPLATGAETLGVFLLGNYLLKKYGLKLSQIPRNALLKILDIDAGALQALRAGGSTVAQGAAAAAAPAAAGAAEAGAAVPAAAVAEGAGAAVAEGAAGIGLGAALGYAGLAAGALAAGSVAYQLMADPRSGAHLFGVNVAIDQRNYDKAIDQAIAIAKNDGAKAIQIGTESNKKASKLYSALQRYSNNNLNISISQNQKNTKRIFRIASNGSIFYPIFSSMSQIETDSLKSTADSIKQNVDNMSRYLMGAGFNNLAEKITNIDLEKTAFENWVNAQTDGAEDYKDNAGTAFSGFGIGEARKHEVKEMVDALHAVPQLRQTFYNALEQQGQQQGRPWKGTSYFEKAGIDPDSYIGTAEQNEALRKAIDPTAPDFDTAFRKKFNKGPGKWNSSERKQALIGSSDI